MMQSINDNEYIIIQQGQARKIKLGATDNVHYVIGKHKSKNEIALSLSNNDSAGLHSKEWINLADIHSLLSQYNGILSSKSFRALFKQKSRNNGGFLVAILLDSQLGLIQKIKGIAYQYIKTEKYNERMAYLQKHWLNKGGKNE